MNIITALLRRYWWILLIAFVLGGVIGGALSDRSTSYKGLLFVTVGIDESKIQNAGDFDYYGVTEGADNFTETVMGWFRSPTMTDTILAEAKLSGSGALLSGPTVSKQELQNVIVDFTATTAGSAREVQVATSNTLTTKLQQFNQNNQSAFTFTIDEGAITSITPSMTRTVGLGAVVALLLVFVLIYLWELLRGVIHDKGEALELLGTPDFLDLHGPQDLPILATYLSNTHRTHILASTGTDIRTQLLPLTRILSKVLHKNVILMDANLQKRDLHTHLGFAQSMKGAKGITDFSDINETNNFFVLERGDKTTLQFIPAGAGEGVSNQFVASLQTVSDINLFATDLPESPEALSIQDSLLVLFVKPGTTRKETLRTAALLSKGPRLIVFI